MAIGNGYAPGGLNVDINVTPLIDVLLVLLIIFMIIVPVTPRGLDSQIPQQPKSPIQNSEAAIVVQVLANSSGQLSYKINQDDVTVQDLGNRLNAIFSTRADKAMFIKGNNNLNFSAIAQVMDIGKGAGANRIALITQNKHEL